MEDEVRRQLEQVQRDISELESRVAQRDAPDRAALTALTAEKLHYSSQLASASQAEFALQGQRARAEGRLSEVERRPANLDAMGTVERLLVAAWSFVFIALTALLIFDATLLVMRNVLPLGLLLALAFGGAGWALAVVVRRMGHG